MALTPEVGKTYLGRDNVKVRIVVIRIVVSPSSAKYIGLRLEGNSGYETPCYYHDDGRATLGDGRDLVSEYHEPDYRWFNVYKDGALGLLRPSLKEAQSKQHYDVLGTYKIDMNTGQIQKEE